MNVSASSEQARGQTEEELDAAQLDLIDQRIQNGMRNHGVNPNNRPQLRQEPITPRGASPRELAGDRRLKEWIVDENAFPDYAKNLPTWKHKEEIRRMFEDAGGHVSILASTTGSGKTTMIGPILQPLLPGDERMIVSQSRKFATLTNSEQTARVMGVEVGREVGYRYRGAERKYSEAETRILFTVNGSLLRQIKRDGLLKGTKIVVVDEVDDPGKDIDMVLGLLKRTQQLRKEAKLPPLEIVCMSATANVGELKSFFGIDDSKIVEIKQDNFPLTETYEQRPIAPEDMPRVAAEKVRQYLARQGEGHIQIFMPGRAEIERTIAEINKLGLADQFDILPLYSQLSKEEQQKVQAENGKRKIIVSTDFGVRGVTIPGVRCGIGSGLIKQTGIDPLTGAEGLHTVKDSWAGIKQAAGRTNRTGPGEFIGLFVKNDPERPEYQMPEILRTNLDEQILLLKKCGVEDVRNFEFVHKPPAGQEHLLQARIEMAIQSLQILGALDKEEKLTPVGELMSDLPIEPRAARMIVAAAQNGDAVEEACTMAAFMEVNDKVFKRPSGHEKEADIFKYGYGTKGSDFLRALEVWEEYEKSKNDPDWEKGGRTMYLDKKILQEIEKNRAELLEVIRKNNIETPKASGRHAIDLAIARGYAADVHVVHQDSRMALEGVYESVFNPNAIAQIRARDTVTPKGTMFAVITSTTFNPNRDRYPHAGPSHPLTAEVLYQVLPGLGKKVVSEPAYSAERDQVERVTTYSIRGIGEDVPMKASVDEGGHAFAIALVGARNFESSVINANRALLDNHKITAEQLITFYEDKIGAVRSKAELEKALSDGLDLTYPYVASPGETIEPISSKSKTDHAAEVPEEIHDAPKKGLLRRIGDVISHPIVATKKAFASIRSYFTDKPKKPGKLV